MHWRNVVILPWKLGRAEWNLKSRFGVWRFYTEMKCDKLSDPMCRLFLLPKLHINIVLLRILGFPSWLFKYDKENEACLHKIGSFYYLIRRFRNTITLPVNCLLSMRLAGMSRYQSKKLSLHDPMFTIVAPVGVDLFEDISIRHRQAWFRM
jgi:hypothetical protein